MIVFVQRNMTSLYRSLIRILNHIFHWRWQQNIIFFLCVGEFQGCTYKWSLQQGSSCSPFLIIFLIFVPLLSVCFGIDFSPRSPFLGLEYHYYNQPTECCLPVLSNELQQRSFIFQNGCILQHAYCWISFPVSNLNFCSNFNTHTEYMYMPPTKPYKLSKWCTPQSVKHERSSVLWIFLRTQEALKQHNNKSY